jgi:glucan 1,3-beta-glucosidase
MTHTTEPAGKLARLKRWSFAGIYALALIVVGFYTWQQYRPHQVADLVLAEGERIQCVSYSPHHKPGQTPLDPNFHAPREQIETDLRALAPRYACVRIYSVAQGLDQVPDIARSLGMKVLVGAWIARIPADNEKELNRAIDLVNRNQDVVRGLIVGNEVLLRRELSEAALLSLIQRAKQEVRVPVTYADVWEFWVQHKALEQAVDFVTVHILPYWEDNPVPIEHAIEHVDDVMAKVESQFTKPVMIGETGWPSLGRQREGAVPNLVNQARFIREFVNHARIKGWNYNLIEAIDAPWKRVLEGTVGGYWGLVDANTLDPKFDLTGPISNLDDTSEPLMAMGSAAILCLAIGLATATFGRGGLRATNFRTICSLLLLGSLAGLVWSLQSEHMRTAYRSDIEWYVLGAVALVAALGTFVLSAAVGRSACLHAADSEDLFNSLLRRAAAWIRGVTLFACATAAILIWLDPRYRDFPYWLYVLPALAYGCGWRLLAPQLALPPPSREEKILAVIIATSAIGRLIPEPLNPEVVTWTLLCLLMAEGARPVGRKRQQ